MPVISELSGLRVRQVLAAESTWGPCVEVETDPASDLMLTAEMALALAARLVEAAYALEGDGRSGSRNGSLASTTHGMTILHWSREGEPLDPRNEPVIGVGVRGAAFDLPTGIYIPLIRAEREGSGDVGRFLDALPRDRRVVFPGVISQRLRGMLERRGFVNAVEDGYELMERRPEGSAP